MEHPVQGLVNKQDVGAPIIWGLDGKTATSLAFIALPRLAHFVLVFQPVGTSFSTWKMRAVLATSWNHGEDLMG